ncbi:MAG TPA: hypothetical protein VKA23_00925 [Mariprofundaceae bacterium]|nr:hypothetical protein [Mariprofundaceae bacterium]
MTETVGLSHFSPLTKHGLNLHAVMNLSTLAGEVRDVLEKQVPQLERYKQLILIGHGGRRMWEVLQASAYRDRPEPVDSLSVDTVKKWLAEACPGAAYEIIYPAAERLVPLQQLGALAGWHHASPFRIGINRQWGSWFAYRAVVLIDSDLPETAAETWGSPCESCVDKPCITACPAGAVADRERMLTLCIDYRLQQDSHCARQCLSRLACPVAVEHRYSREQIDYHYGQSLQTIRIWRQRKDGF